MVHLAFSICSNVLAWKGYGYFLHCGPIFRLHIRSPSMINKIPITLSCPISSKVKPSPAPPGPTGVGEGQAWEVVTESRSLGRYQPRVGGYCLPVWATTWKTMIFVFRQQKPWWDREWPSRPPPEPQDKTPQLLALETQVDSTL